MGSREGFEAGLKEGPLPGSELGSRDSFEHNLKKAPHLVSSWAATKVRMMDPTMAAKTSSTRASKTARSLVWSWAAVMAPEMAPTKAPEMACHLVKIWAP